MKITFISLAESHFPLLLSWLENPHVKLWWPIDQMQAGEAQELYWTIDLIKQKYGDYVKGYKLDDGTRKPISAYIIRIDADNIGYIQAYNFYDFPRDGYELTDMPKSLAAIDIFIGEQQYISRNIGSKAMELFIEEYVFKDFDYVFVDPAHDNLAAIGAYKKAGFTTVQNKNLEQIFMLKRKDS